jgi:hypothetical protein
LSIEQLQRTDIIAYRNYVLPHKMEHKYCQDDAKQAKEQGSKDAALFLLFSETPLGSSGEVLKGYYLRWRTALRMVWRSRSYLACIL